MSQPVLLLDDLALAFNQQRLLAGINLELRQGQIGALLGASGSGKSSLLRAIAGFLAPHQGHIMLDGVVVSSADYQWPPHQRGVGLMFQEHALFPHLRVADNIAFGLSALSRSARRQRVEELLALIGLQGFGQRWPHELSGGQQQRVALARALAPAPRLLLLDEPFASLDSELRSRLAAELRQLLKAQQITALLVTHDQQEAFAMADKVGVIAAGQLQQWSSPYTLYHEPANRLVADFIGEGEFLPAEVLSPTRFATELGELSSHYPHPLQAGQQARVLLRPDDLLLRREPAPGRPQASVSQRQFRGAEYLYQLQLDSGHQLLALMPSHVEFDVGERVGIELRAEHIIAFAD